MKMFVDGRSRKVSDCHRYNETDSDAGGPTQIREFSIFVFLIFHWALQEKVKLYNALADESIKKNEKVRMTM
jgi:predicted transcriptional regulator